MTLPPPPSDWTGRTVGPYRLERFIGQGGFAWVFAGRDADGTPVAVKILQPVYAGDPQFEARFRNESETASALTHPHIVRIRAVSKTGPDVYFSMDLYADSLAARLSREGPLPEADILAIAKDIAAALAFAHERGIIHRDLKPDNILLGSDGRAVLSDFGIARAISGYVTSTGVNLTMGTPQYLSPEQAQGRPTDARSDLYSLGITLYKAATGDVPFAHAAWYELARAHVEEAPPPLRKKRPDLSKPFERVVLKCLAKHPDDRYGSAVELATELAHVAETDRSRSSRRRRWIVGVAVAAGLGVLVGLVRYARKRR